MSRIVRTTHDDTVDLLAWRHYGDRIGATEAILAANTHLGAQPAILPPGLDIVLPTMGIANAPERFVVLWPGVPA